MPVGSVGKWLVLGSLVATLGASGCKEDNNGDDDNPTDSGSVTDSGTDSGGGGGTDSGATDAGAKDSGPVDSGPPPVMCGGKTCMSYSPSPIIPAFAAGCAKDYLDAEVCGLSSASVASPDSGVPPFFERDAPGADSPSCGAFLESKVEMPVDAGGADAGDAGANNGAIDSKRTISGIEVFLTTPGCCTPAGFCSGHTGKATSTVPSLMMVNPSNGGYGCMNPKYLFAAAPPALQAIPCDPDSGMIKVPSSGDAGADAGSDAGASDAGADGGNG